MLPSYSPPVMKFILGSIQRTVYEFIPDLPSLFPDYHLFCVQLITPQQWNCVHELSIYSLLVVKVRATPGSSGVSRQKIVI